MWRVMRVMFSGVAVLLRDFEVNDGAMVSGSYRHTQIGCVLLVALGIGAIGALGIVLSWPSPTAISVLITLVLCLLLFPTLTVIGGPNGIEARFGPGLIRKRFVWADITSASQVRNSWLVGWGIRWIGSGWVLNVSGFDAVELRLKNGRKFRIGTDDPHGLHTFIERGLKEQ
jgi:hypothetical protein